VPCLDDDTILAVAVGDTGAAVSIEAHLDACDRCRRLVAEAMRGEDRDEPRARSMIGRVLLNHRVTRKIGEGGFGEVYEAEHVELGRRSAVKVLRPEYAAAPIVVERFFREARAACAIDHPAVVEIENFGRLDTGEPFYLMELLDGQTLADAITANGPLPADRLRAVFEPIAGALAQAHQRGIIHRDLKPENIMLPSRPDGRVKLLDFGIAKLLEQTGGLRSRTGHVIGTPLYMAPEQADDEHPVDTRADIYSFAATFFTAATGRPPFIARNVMVLLAALQGQKPPRLRTLAPWVSGDLDDAIARCLAKDPADRPARIEDAWDAIARGLAPPALARPRRRRMLAFAAAVVAVGGLAGAASVLATRGGSGTAEPPAAPGIVDAARAPTPVEVAPVDAAIAVAPPPPAPVDAAAVPAPVATAPRPPSSRPKKPPAAHAQHPVSPYPDEPLPDPRCTRARFDRVLRDTTLPLEEVRDALQDLRGCRSRGQISVEEHERIQRALISRL